MAAPTNQASPASEIGSAREQAADIGKIGGLVQVHGSQSIQGRHEGGDQAKAAAQPGDPLRQSELAHGVIEQRSPAEP